MPTRKWSEIRRGKVPDEAAAGKSGRALRDALALNELRTAMGLTQVQLADRMKVAAAAAWAARTYRVPRDLLLRSAASLS